EGLKIARKNSVKNLIDWVYTQSQNGVSKDAICDVLKLSKNICA
ncbi:MAG: hypothetical protein ACI8WT_004605, partial [Clostridium sp.]